MQEILYLSYVQNKIEDLEKKKKMKQLKRDLRNE